MKWEDDLKVSNSEIAHLMIDIAYQNAKSSSDEENKDQVYSALAYVAKATRSIQKDEDMRNAIETGAEGLAEIKELSEDTKYSGYSGVVTAAATAYEMALKEADEDTREWYAENRREIENLNEASFVKAFNQKPLPTLEYHLEDNFTQLASDNYSNVEIEEPDKVKARLEDGERLLSPTYFNTDQNHT